MEFHERDRDVKKQPFSWENIESQGRYGHKKAVISSQHLKHNFQTQSSFISNPDFELRAMSSQVIPQDKRMSPEFMYPSEHDKAVRKRRNIVAALVALTLIGLIGVIVAVVVVTSDDSTSGGGSSSAQQQSGGGASAPATTTTRRTTRRTTTTAARVTTTTTAAAAAEEPKKEEAPAAPTDCSSVRTSASGRPCLFPYEIEVSI